MPAYTIEYTADRGIERVRFTLDDDRPLAAQVPQILEELRQRGSILQGGPDDELTLVHNGALLDQTRTPRDLQISPQWPMELRMRRKAEPKRTVSRRFVPKGAYATAIAGTTGALLAWLAGTSFTDLGTTISTYTRLDQLAMLLLGAGIGAAALGADAYRRAKPVALAVLGGLLLGALGGFIGGSAGVGLARALSEKFGSGGFVAGRILGWAVAGMGVSLALAAWWARLEPRRLTDALPWGILGGALAGLICSLPGQPDFWQALACMTLGAGVGFAVCGPALLRAPAILERESAGATNLLALREWPLRAGAPAALPGRGAPSVIAQGGKFTVVPAGVAVVVAGKPAGGPTPLRHGDTIQVAGQGYRYRERSRA